ncbi:MAG: bifunctional tetrahydrofolate synthase/dihydrofolate synthase [Gammaproteobacteria bacterium]|nr:bifunctional tetrahydrofolate synthase/dihydrofolate synthase [Gammaproteobacteria bacterium]MCP5137470.1 bifunctional tetrahydrofolate synthase/dihydrofolate synthase [Gammaproteobacteria bacterium]
MARFARLSDWLAWLEGLHPKAIDLGLDRIGRVWQRLGAPAIAAEVVTVAGTNGKGSSVAMLDAILGAAGYKVGRFTSPHFVRFNERVVVAGREVDDLRLIDAFERIDQARGGISLSYFEFTALAAFLCFADAGLDVVLLEVGLGGRLDAVNIIDADVALITAIDLDHQDWLGNDREAIGREKAGILRAGRVAVCSDPNPPASVAERAKEIGATLLCLGPDYQFVKEGETWDWSAPGRRWAGLPKPALPGRFQMDNAAGVLAVIATLKHEVSRAAIERGLRSVHWPGRWQVVDGVVPVVLDVAHNPHSAGGLASQLAEQPTARTLAVCGMLRTKDVVGVLKIMQPHIDAWFPVNLPSPLGLDVEAMRAHLDALPVAAPVMNCDNVEQALQVARDRATPGDRILVFGSFVTVEQAMRVLDAAPSPSSQSSE